MEEYYSGWIQRLGELFDELIAARQRREGDLRDLINRTLAHYKAYYQERSSLAERDVLLVFSQPWLTPFERTFLWVAGWRPSLTFRLLEGEATGAVREQEAETAEEEQTLTAEMSRLQEIMAAPAMVAVIRRATEHRNGQSSLEEERVLEHVLRSLQVLLQKADDLRVRVVKGLVRVLTEEKMVDLLASATHLHLRLHSRGTRLAAAAEA